MADVTGTIGTEYVELNNAATEATLKLLLAAITGGNAKATANINSIATKAGLDPATVAKANDGLKNSAVAGEKSAGAFNKVAAGGASAAQGLDRLSTSLSPLIDKLLAGTAQASDAFGALEKLPGVLGVVMGLFGKVATYQQDNVKTYQQITQVGANFGGSLTDLRQAALNTYMSLTEFGTFVKSNGEALARMGGNVDSGTRAFVRLSKDLISSEIGTNLMALGYSTEQINSTMATYIASTGGRTRQEMQNTQALAASTAAYMTELDALTQFTGVSKDKIAEEGKKAAQNEAFQRKLSTMDEAERAKTKAAYDKAAASGVAGATDLVMSAALGLPPVTKSAQILHGIAPGVAAGFTAMTKTAMDQTKTMKDVNSGYGKILLEGKAASQQIGQTGDAVVMIGGEYSKAMNGIIGLEMKANAQGIANEEDYEKSQEEIRLNRIKQEKSQAAIMAETDKAFKEIGQSTNDLLSPAIKWATEMIATMSKGLAFLITGFNNLSLEAKLLVAGISALVLWKSKELIAEKLAMAKDKASDAISKAKGMVPGSSPATALWVRIVGKGTPGAAGGAEDILDKKDKNKPDTTKPSTEGGGKASKLAKLANAAKGGVGSLAGGLVLDYAADKARESKNTELAAGLDIGSSALSGAGMGAMMGSIVPGVGTVIGGAVGGLVGGAYGAYQNWGGLTGKKPMADGGIVDRPTNALVGEAGPEIVSPIKYFENLQTELVTLNKQTVEMLRFLKETAEQTRNTAEATKGLSGDLFKF